MMITGHSSDCFLVTCRACTSTFYSSLPRGRNTRSYWVVKTIANLTFCKTCQMDTLFSLTCLSKRPRCRSLFRGHNSTIFCKVSPFLFYVTLLLIRFSDFSDFDISGFAYHPKMDAYCTLFKVFPHLSLLSHSHLRFQSKIIFC